MKRSAAMFARAAGTNVVPNVKSKDNVCKDKMFQGEEFMSSLLNTTEQNKTKHNWKHASTDFDVWLEIRAELEKSIVEQELQTKYWPYS